MSRILMSSAIVGLAFVASACSQTGHSDLFGGNESLEMADVAESSGSTARQWVPIDFHDARLYGPGG